MPAVSPDEPALPGWRGVCKPDPNRHGGWAVILHSPDYNPETGAGDLVTGRGDDPDAAMADAVALGRRALLTTTKGRP